MQQGISVITAVNVQHLESLHKQVLRIIGTDVTERIFPRFAQIPDKVGYRGGSGLRLSIAREFITTQGDRRWVESDLGSGSRFCFTLLVVK